MILLSLPGIPCLNYFLTSGLLPIIKAYSINLSFYNLLLTLSFTYAISLFSVLTLKISLKYDVRLEYRDEKNSAGKCKKFLLFVFVSSSFLD